jgi:molecular chaperone GrpE
MVKKADIKKLDEQIKDLNNKWKRALADYQNLEKRFEQEKKEFVKFSNAALLDKLLGVLDDLQRAEKHINDKGLSIAIDQFKSVLKTEGVEEIEAKGQEFDPELMDCVDVVKGEKDRAMEVLQKGYKLNNKVLRPAKVNVGIGNYKKKKTK